MGGKPESSLPIHRFDNVRLRNGVGVIDSSEVVHRPPVASVRAALPIPLGPGQRSFCVAEIPEPIAMLQTGGGPMTHNRGEEGAVQTLLEAGFPVVAWIGPEAQGGAIIHCYSKSEAAIEGAACGAWALMALGGWDETPIMAFHVSHVSGYRRDESFIGVDKVAAVWVTARGTLGARGWSVEIRRTPAGWAAIQHAIDALEHPSLVAVNVDWAMAYNDAYGHIAGDLMLARIHSVAAQIADRCSGLLIRSGGDEFALVLDSSVPGAGLACAEAVRRSVYELQLPFEHSEVRTHGRVTVSVGVLPAENASGMRESQLHEAAKDVVYKAKLAGRNATRVSEEMSRRL